MQFPQNADHEIPERVKHICIEHVPNVTFPTILDFIYVSSFQLNDNPRPYDVIPPRRRFHVLMFYVYVRFAFFLTSTLCVTY